MLLLTHLSRKENLLLRRADFMGNYVKLYNVNEVLKETLVNNMI